MHNSGVLSLIYNISFFGQECDIDRRLVNICTRMAKYYENGFNIGQYLGRLYETIMKNV